MATVWAHNNGPRIVPSFDPRFSKSIELPPRRTDATSTRQSGTRTLRSVHDYRVELCFDREGILREGEGGRGRGRNAYSIDRPIMRARVARRLPPPPPEEESRCVRGGVEEGRTRRDGGRAAAAGASTDFEQSGGRRTAAADEQTGWPSVRRGSETAM